LSEELGGKMKTLIVGAGAMGSLVGGLLAESGVDVTLFDVAREQIAAIRERGLIIERENQRRLVRVKAVEQVEGLNPADLIIVLVKSYDTETAVKGIKSCVGPDTMILTLQNGLGNTDIIAQEFSSVRVFGGVTSHGAMLLAPGIVRHNGGAKTHVGPVVSSELGRAELLARLLSEAGMDTLVSRDIKGILWTKLIVNAAINPLTGLTGKLNGELLDGGDLQQIMGAVVREAVQVSQKLKIRLQREDMLYYVQTICQVTAKNRSSMLMDLLKHRRTEINAINGKIVEEGQKCQIPTPVNECLTKLIRSVEKGDKGIFPQGII